MKPNYYSLHKLATILTNYLDYKNNSLIYDLSAKKDDIKETIKLIYTNNYQLLLKNFSKDDKYFCPDYSAFIIIFFSLPIDSQYERNDKKTKKESPFSRAKKFNFNLLMDMSDQSKHSLMNRFGLFLDEIASFSDFSQDLRDKNLANMYFYLFSNVTETYYNYLMEKNITDLVLSIDNNAFDDLLTNKATSLDHVYQEIPIFDERYLLEIESIEYDFNLKVTDKQFEISKNYLPKFISELKENIGTDEDLINNIVILENIFCINKFILDYYNFNIFDKLPYLDPSMSEIYPILNDEDTLNRNKCEKHYLFHNEVNNLVLKQLSYLINSLNGFHRKDYIHKTFNCSTKELISLTSQLNN